LILQDKILNDLKQTKVKNTKESLKVIIGELQRQPTKILSDDQVIDIIKKLKKYEEERLEKLYENKDSLYLETLKKYLPVQVSEEEIRNWINQNIDFKSLKKPEMAIGIVCKYFGKSVDGNLVKDIVRSL